MAAATDNRKWAGDGTNLIRANPGNAWNGPVAANAVLYEGCLAGHLLSDTATFPGILNYVADGTMRCLGFVTIAADNTGGALGARMTRVLAETGTLVDKNAGGGNAFTMANLYLPAYGVDNQTCSKLQADGPCIGIFTGIDRVSLNPVVLVDPFVASTISGADLPAGSVITAALAANAVTAAKIAAGAVTGVKIAPVGAFRMIKNVAGRNGAGACTATGAQVGDIVLGVNFAKVPTAAAATQAGLTAFESTITVLNQIQQTGAANLSSENFDVLLLAQS